MQNFNKRGLTREELEAWLHSWDGQEFVIGTSLYRVVPAAGSRPRRLVAVEEDADDKPDAPESPRRSRPKMKMHGVTLEMVLEHAAIHNGGSLAFRPLLEYFNTLGMGQRELERMLADAEGQTYTIGSHNYQVMPSNGGNIPRMLKEITS
jgi:hypothetical protein